MEILIKKVNVGAKYQGKIYDYFIEGQLKSNKRIQIHDSKAFDLRKYIGKEIEGLIMAISFNFIETYGKKTSDDTISGYFIKDYIITSNWSNYKNQKRMALKTEDGIFLLDSGEFDLSDIHPGEGSYLSLKVLRFVLLDCNQPL